MTDDEAAAIADALEEGADIVHVYPLRTQRPHETDDDPCWCDPCIEEVEGQGYVIMHRDLN